MSPTLLLIGARGSGKTSVGRHAASAAGLPFVDLDDRVLSRFPEASVVEVWRVHGEGAWREAEVEALRTALDEGTQVVALGGGTPVIEAARELIERARRRGRVRVAYLRCSAEELARRLQTAPGDRPSLTGAPPAREIAAVLAAREPVYEALADAIIECDDIDQAAAAREVAERLRANGDGDPRDATPR